ncbi:MAG: putative lipoate-protein ligase [Planctomycetota bacterium]
MRQTTSSPPPEAEPPPEAATGFGGDAFVLGPAAPAEWLEPGLSTVADHLALDEALLEAAHEGRLDRPVIRTWMAAEPTVVVGSSSRIDEEVDRGACEREGVTILRRPSGGLTVVLGPGCLMWTVVASLPAAPPAIERIHATVLDPLAAALVAAGRPVVRRGSSDLAVAGSDGERKVSGNALRVRRGGVLYHGTLLDAFDLELIGRVLRHPPREPAYRARRDHAAFLANLGLGRPALEAAVRQAFAATRCRTAWPADRVAALVRERYASPAWTERLS